MDVQTIVAPPTTGSGAQPTKSDTATAAAQVADAVSSLSQPSSAPPSVDGVRLPPQNGTIAGAVAKLFGSSPGLPPQINLNVSYRVEPHSNSIVTVFSDPRTGKEIAQFPAEILLSIAQFFDQHQGATLDHNA